MKKQEIARENIFSSIGRVTVVVYSKADTDKQTLSTILYANKSQLVPSISAQMIYRPGHGRTLEETVKNVIARTVTKYEADYRPQREHIDYAQAYGNLPDDVKHQLCPAQWRAESTRRAALTYYERRSIPVLQRILDRIDDPSTLEEAQRAYLALARKNTDRGEANALMTANKHITEANLLYEASRYVLPQYDLPPIEIPLFMTESIVPPEQAKALPRDDLVRLAELIRLDSSKTPLAAGAALMLCCLLRPAEVCPKYGEIVDCDNFGVYAAVHNVFNGERVSTMKTSNAYRQVILPKYVMDSFVTAVRYCAARDTVARKSRTLILSTIIRISVALLTLGISVAMLKTSWSCWAIIAIIGSVWNWSYRQNPIWMTAATP